VRLHALLAAALVAGCPAPVLAIGSAEKGDTSIEAIGAMRLTSAYLHYPDEPLFFPPGDEGLVAGVTRLILDGGLGAYLDYEANLYADLSYTPESLLGGTFATAGSFETPYRTTYLSWDFWQSGGMSGQLGVDRLAIDLEVDRITMSLGRFPVNHSVTYIFTPNDFFAPFSPTAINKLYKPGVDALELGVSTGLLSNVEIVAVMGYGTNDVPAWGRSAVLARASAVLWNFEWALLGGKVAERWIVGASFQGDVGPFTFRGEGHAGFPDSTGNFVLDDVDADGDYRDDIHGRLAAGIDVNVAWHNTTIGVEYMFLSGGADSTSRYLERATRFFPDDILYLGMHYVGLSAGLDILPIWRFNTMLMFNATDYSGLAALMFSYSISDEADALVGLLLPWGEEPVADSGPPTYGPSIESEFGLLPIMIFLEMKFYF
jgi:hypothetical protein